VKAIKNEGLKTKQLVVRVSEDFREFIKENQIQVTKVCIRALQKEARRLLKEKESN